MDNSILVKRYILLHIYLEKWKPGQKILSANQISIKFNLSKQTIKKILQLFLDNNILITKKRVGYFVNEKIYDYLPLSLRHKYSLKPLKFYFKEDDSFWMKKEYSINGISKDVWVETSMENNVFMKINYQKNKTFMWNLSYVGIVVFKFHSNFKFKKIRNKNFIIEYRQLFNGKEEMIAKEKIFIPAEIWKENKKNTIL